MRLIGLADVLALSLVLAPLGALGLTIPQTILLRADQVIA